VNRVPVSDKRRIGRGKGISGELFISLVESAGFNYPTTWGKARLLIYESVYKGPDTK